jgi:hypothetical protein
MEFEHARHVHGSHSRLRLQPVIHPRGGGDRDIGLQRGRMIALPQGKSRKPGNPLLPRALELERAERRREGRGAALASAPTMSSRSLAPGGWARCNARGTHGSGETSPSVPPES